MKLSILTACLLFTGAAAFAAPAPQAAAPKAQTHKAATEKAKMMWASGTVEKFDAATKMLTIKQGGKDVTFAVDDQTHVMKGKEMLQPSSLTAGQNARIEYTMAGASKSARVVNVSEAKSAAPKKS